MSSNFTPVCERGLTAETVSAWRDGTLNTREQQTMDEHVPSCPSCRLHAAAFDEVGRILRSQRVAAPSPALWMDVRAGIANQGSGSRGRVLRPSIWSGFGALAAVLVITALFVQLFSSRLTGTGITHSPTASTTASHTATAAPFVTNLSWAQTAQPAAAPPPPAGIALAVSAGNANTAYSCYGGTAGGAPRIYATSDAGAHWRLAGTLPTTQEGCELVVDALNPAILVAGTYTLPAPATLAPRSYFASFDGGAHWQQLGTPSTLLYRELATPGGQSPTYGLRLVQEVPSLGVSSDHFTTWLPIDSTIQAAHQVVSQFWASATGEILALTTPADASAPRQQLWLSPDGGANWRQLDNVPQMDSYFAEAAPGGTSWRICGVTLSKDVTTVQTMTDLRCTPDVGSGQTWQKYPLLQVAHAIPQTQADAVAAQAVLGIAPDGRLLAVDGDEPIQGTPNLHVYALDLSSTTSAWTAIGTAPTAPVALYYAGDSGGTLWAGMDFPSAIYTAAYAG